MQGAFRRRPVWQPSTWARSARFLRGALKQVTFRRAVIAFFLLPLLFYVYREVTRDDLIIDPFAVPRSFEESGLTSEAMASRIGDALHQIETTTKSRLKKENLASARDEGAVPDVEIPGTKIGLKTLVDITRAIFGIYPKHVSGDIVVAAHAESQATVTLYITQGRNRGPAVSLDVSDSDIGLLARRTAEMVLGQVNPYVLAAHRYVQGDHDAAVSILRSIVQDPSEDRVHKRDALIFWGNLLAEKRRFADAIGKYQKAIELDPKDDAPYIYWGLVFVHEKKYDDAVAMYQQATRLSPRDDMAFTDWGTALGNERKYDEAIAKFHKAIELNPKSEATYLNWGTVLHFQKQYDEAAAKYQKALELDPSDAGPYLNWGVLLAAQKKYDDAIAKFQASLELDPKNPVTYRNWGMVLYAQKRYDEAAAKLRRAIDLDPRDADAHTDLGVVLTDDGQYQEALREYTKARVLSQQSGTP